MYTPAKWGHAYSKSFPGDIHALHLALVSGLSHALADFGRNFDSGKLVVQKFRVATAGQRHDTKNKGS